MRQPKDFPKLMTGTRSFQANLTILQGSQNHGR